MSAEYVKKVNDKPLAASEVAPSSPLATTIAGKQDSLGIDPTSGSATKFLNEKGQFAVPAQAPGAAYEYTNEINYTNVPTSGNKNRHWFNYRNGDTGQPDPNNLLSDYYFGNRNNETNDVYLHADGFAPRIISGTNSNVLPFVKFVCTNTGTNKGFVHFKCVFMGTNNDDGMGQTDITIKIRQNTWHGLALKCLRVGGSGDTSYGNAGNMIYWETTIDGNPVFYIGVRPTSFNARLSVFVQYCELNGTATYTLGNFNSEVTNLAIGEGDNRDVSRSLYAVKAAKAEGIVDAGNTSSTLTLDYTHEIAQIKPMTASSTTRSATKWIAGAYTGGKFEVCDAANVTTGSSLALFDASEYKRKMQFEFNPSDIGNNATAPTTKTYWVNIPTTTDNSTQFNCIYNNRDTEYSLIASKSSSTSNNETHSWGSVLRWSYWSPTLEILRCWKDNWRTDDWEPIAQPSVLCFTYTDTSSGMSSLFTELCKSISHTTGSSSSSIRYDMTVLYRGGYFYPLVYFNKAGSGGNYQYTWRFANTGVYGINMITQMVFTVVVPASGTTTYSWSTESETRWKQQVGSVGTDSMTIYYT